MPTSAEALRALQLQEVRWQALLDTAWDAIIGIDPLRQFKKFAREQRLQLRDLDLPAFLREIVAAWEQEASERGIALEVEVGHVLPPIHADHKLRRVMDNLVKTRWRRSITVRVSSASQRNPRNRNGCAFSSDNGPRIAGGIDIFCPVRDDEAQRDGARSADLQANR